MKLLTIGCIALILLEGCMVYRKANYTSPTLEIERLTMHTFVHRSFLQSKDFGHVSCNGLIYIIGDEAIVFDTPTNDSVSGELIRWIELTRKAKVKAVVVNHFHVDCLGGLGAFHKSGIPSYSNKLTRELAAKDTANHPVVPQNGFSDTLTLTVGKHKVINRYHGPGHTRDNIVSYIPDERVLFGGCIIKAMRAGKGNLADADVDSWNSTVRRIKDAYPKAKYVIPGHGAYGGIELLDYTRTLFPMREHH